MSRRDPDTRIDAWLREELDAVPQPLRAVSAALDAAAITPQHRGRLFWLRQLLGLEHATVQRGTADHPEVVLTSGTVGSTSTSVFGRGGAISTPIVLIVLALALTVMGAMTWMVVGPGRELVGGSDGVEPIEQPQRPLDPPGPNRVILVGGEDPHFNTLSGAIAAAVAGDRIQLEPGTYEAEVTITEDISIVGAGDRESIVVQTPALAPGEDVRDRMRNVFTLQDSDATLQGFTVRGSLNGTAIVVDGGSPMLLDLDVDPVGAMDIGSPSTPREAIEFGGGTTATLRDTVMTSLSSVIEGAAPLIENVTFDTGCLLVEDAGSSPVIRDATFDQSQCPGFSISVASGANATIEANHIYSRPDQAGIRVANDGTTVSISGSDITGGREGVSISFGADANVHRTQINGAEVGIRVKDADAVLELNRLMSGGTGLEVSGETYLETFENDICDNELNLDLRDGALVPLAQNRVCAEGSSELAVEDGAE